MNPGLSYAETQVVAVLLNDETGERVRKARHLPPAAFSDATCRALWPRILSLSPGEPAGMALVGCRLDEDELRRVSETPLSTLNFAGNLKTVSDAWIDGESKLVLADMQRGVISLTEGRARLSEIAEAAPNNRTDWPALVSAEHLCAAPPPTPPAVIEGVLYRGGTMLLSGPSKSHKTFTMLAAACAIAEGKPWLGFQTVATPVIYINLELQDFALAERVSRICKASGGAPPATLEIWNLRGQNVTLMEIERRLPAMIRRLGAGLVVIDPHYKVSAASGMEENSNDSQGKLLSALEAICNLNGAALIIAHHFAKGDAASKNAIDRASGGGVLARWGDAIVTFTNHEEVGAMTIEMALRNYAPVEPFCVRWDYPVWSLDGALDPQKLKKAGRPVEVTADTVLAALGFELMSFKEWSAKAGNLKETTMRRRVDDLIAKKRVEKIGPAYRRKPNPPESP